MKASASLVLPLLVLLTVCTSQPPPSRQRNTVNVRTASKAT